MMLSATQPATAGASADIFAASTLSNKSNLFELLFAGEFGVDSSLTPAPLPFDQSASNPQASPAPQQTQPKAAGSNRKQEGKVQAVTSADQTAGPPAILIAPAVFPWPVPTNIGAATQVNASAANELQTQPKIEPSKQGSKNSLQQLDGVLQGVPASKEAKAIFDKAVSVNTTEALECDAASAEALNQSAHTKNINIKPATDASTNNPVENATEIEALSPGPELSLPTLEQTLGRGTTRESIFWLSPFNDSNGRATTVKEILNPAPVVSTSLSGGSNLDETSARQPDATPARDTRVSAEAIAENGALASPHSQPTGFHIQHLDRSSWAKGIAGWLTGETPSQAIRTDDAQAPTRMREAHRTNPGSFGAGDQAVHNTATESQSPQTSSSEAYTAGAGENKPAPIPNKTDPAKPATEAIPAATASQVSANPLSSGNNGSQTLPVNSAPATPPPASSATNGVTAKSPAPDIQGAATVPPTLPVQVHAARIVQSTNLAEMHLDMRTQSFGGVEIHTTITGKDVQLAVTAEHGDLRSFLAPEVPVLQNSLQQHDLRLERVHTVPNTGAQPEFSSGSGRQEQRFARQRPRTEAFQQSEEMSAVFHEEGRTKGLSIRI